MNVNGVMNGEEKPGTKRTGVTTMYALLCLLIVWVSLAPLLTSLEGGSG
jgi:hypothetical protein